MEINIKTKFEIGQEVQIIKETVSIHDIKEFCPLCGGEGRFIYNRHDICCPECKGLGTVVKGHRSIIHYGFKECGKIATIRIQTNTPDSIRVLYKIGGKFIPEHMICGSKEEANRLCIAFENGTEYLWHRVCEQPRFNTDVIAVDKEGKIHNIFRSGMGIVKWRYAGIYDKYMHKNYIWCDVDNYPKVDRDIIVMDKNGKEYDRHQWIGHAYYRFTPDSFGGYDGYRSDVDIVKWRYA